MTQRQKIVKICKIFGAIVALALVFFGGWWALYPGLDDPKGMMYIGWRLGLPTLDQDRALGTMVGDVHRGGLVVGKTKDELIDKFGYVTTLDQASEYVQYCYYNSPYFGKQALVLRHSNWTVLMKDGRATELIIAKGC
jgi:hypothetical protein